MNIWYIVMNNSHLRAQNASECDLKTSNFENFPGAGMPPDPLRSLHTDSEYSFST